MTAARTCVPLLLLALVVLGRNPHVPASADDPPAKAGAAALGDVAAFARKHCLACHNSKDVQGGFDVEDLLKSDSVGANPAAWHSVLERVASRDMPPKKVKVRPTEAEFRAAEDRVRDQLTAFEALAASKRPRPLRRLNRDEYNRSIQQVFGLPAVRPADNFPPDDAVDGFTNIGEGLGLSAVLVEQYLAAGQQVARLALTDGPQPPSKVRHFALGSKDYGSTFRGHDPGGAVREGKWVGDHLYVVFDAPAGTYRVRLTAAAKNLASRPGYVPNFQYRANGLLVFQADAPVKGEALAQEFALVLPTGGHLDFDFRWVNGFPDNNGLRAKGLRLPEWTDKYANGRTEVWNYLRFVYEPEKKKNPDTPYPFPYLEDAKLEVEGPLFPDGWPASRFQRENADAIARKDASAVAAWLLPRLYRRPAKPDELTEFAAFVAKSEAALAEAKPEAVPKEKRFVEALRLAVQRALVSPHFLFLVEPGPVGRKLTDHELAARLSYFLWAAPPDEELARLAAEGKLRPALAAQTKRVLADPRSRAFVDRFTTEWLGLDRLASIMPEPDLYPRFDAQGLLRQDMAAEPRALVAHLLAANGPLFDLLDADYTFLNDRLADHYHLPSLWSMFPVTRDGFAPVSGGDFRKVALPDGRRGGLVTTAAFLALTSENSRTSPVRRGVWVLEKLFNRTPPPPPPNVAGVLPDTTAGTTAAEKLKLHRDAPNCAGCHARIDPFGLALENFDAIGEWRDREPPHIDPASPVANLAATRARLKLTQYQPLPTFPIDTTFSLGGVEGQGVPALKKYLAANRDKFARGFSEKLATYALGRRTLVTDEPELARVREAALKDGFRFQALVLALVESPLFQTR
ncbi:DUF1592 domain-containing protein [Gemmata sp.]|uniref:DUF1592 domain-containing protein n=1 Tax=Gemmata sp. TaxID=1914242 RepID=UPI003F6F5CA4